MRLYPKKLRSVEDLEREKKLLLREMQLLEEEELLSVESIFNKKGAKREDESEGGLMGLLSFLPVANPLLQMVIKAAQGWLSKRREAPSTLRGNGDTEKRKGKSVLRSVAIEVIGGYLKWKAVELSFKGVRHIIKKRRERKQE